MSQSDRIPEVGVPTSGLDPVLGGEVEAAVDPFGVTDYLQLASFNRRSVALEIELVGGRRGSIQIVDGEAWSATLVGVEGQGVDELAVLVGERATAVHVRELSERPKTRGITIPTHALLLDLARIQDEARRAESAEVSGVFQRPGEWDLDDLDGLDGLEDLDALDGLDALGGPEESPASSEGGASGPGAGGATDEEAQGPEAALRCLLSQLSSGQPRAADPDPGSGSGPGSDLEGAELWEERHWPKAALLGQAPAELDPRVYLVGFDAQSGAALLAKLANLNIPARLLGVDELVTEAVVPLLLVQYLEVEDEGPPFACFDLAWTLRASGRLCPWMVVTDWPTRYTKPLCAALGAFAWHDLGFVSEHESELAPAIAAHLEATALTALKARLGALDVALMLIDARVDATLEILDERDGARRGRIALSEGELWAAEAVDPEGGPSLRGLVAGKALCADEGVQVQVRPPIPTRERNLPRGLALALAALTRELPGTLEPTPPWAAQELDNMSRLNTVCSDVVNDLPDALACGVIDLNTGMLMGIHHTISYFSQSYLDAVAAAAVDMFRGKNVQRVEKLISKHRGEEVHDAFEEIFVSSRAVFHFMKLIREKSAVVVLVTRKTTNQGMGWSTLRVAVDEIVEALP